MRAPLRKFSMELLSPGRKKSSTPSTPSSEKEKGFVDVQIPVIPVAVPETMREPKEKEKERRPSLERWKKVPRLFSQARFGVSKSSLPLRVTLTPRASSLDVSRSKDTSHTTQTPTLVTQSQSQSQSQTPPFPPTPSSLSLSLSTIGMSDFLSRESELLGGEFSPTPGAGGGLGGTEIDLDAAASAFPDISLDGSGDIPNPTPVPSALNAMPTGFGDFEMVREKPAPSRVVKVTGDDDIERFEDQFPDIGGTSPPIVSPAIPQQPTFGAPPPFAPRPQPSAFSSTPILAQPLADEDEPEVIRAWREKQAEEIKRRDEASQARRQETIAKAERSIDQFYEEYNAKKERNIKENKVQESEYLSSFTDSLSAGTTWSRICEYIDLQNSQSKTLARTGAGTTDLSRFKEVLLRLKREGDAAPGAAGY